MKEVIFCLLIASIHAVTVCVQVELTTFVVYVMLTFDISCGIHVKGHVMMLEYTSYIQMISQTLCCIGCILLLPATFSEICMIKFCRWIHAVSVEVENQLKMMEVELQAHILTKVRIV